MKHHPTGVGGDSQMASGWLFSIIFCPAFMMVAPAGLARAEGATRHVNVDSGGYAIGRYDPVA